MSKTLNERWGVIGHTWAIESIERAAAAERLAHAVLLTGPHGIGKTTIARALARRLECTDANPPCNVCRACIKNEKGVSPDVRLVEGVPVGWKIEKDGPPPPRRNDRERRNIIVDQIRDLENWLATAPFESKYKIVILRRFEDANESASNAFLKTLEEPPSHVYLILTAQDANMLLPTIASRCQKLTLRPLPLATVEAALVGEWNVARKADSPAGSQHRREARLLARLSSGRIGWAVRASADPKILEARADALGALNGMLNEGRAERLTRAGDLAKESDQLPQLLELWLTWWRDLLLLQSGDGARIVNVDWEDALRAEASQFSIEQVHAALTATRAAARQLEQNANARLVTEVLALSLPRAK